MHFVRIFLLTKTPWANAIISHLYRWGHSSPGLEDLLKTAAHSSILAWRIPWTEEPGGPQSMGLQWVWHDWATNTHKHIHTHPWLSQMRRLKLEKLQLTQAHLVNTRTDMPSARTGTFCLRWSFHAPGCLRDCSLRQQSVMHCLVLCMAQPMTQLFSTFLIMSGDIWCPFYLLSWKTRHLVFCDFCILSTHNNAGI